MSAPDQRSAGSAASVEDGPTLADVVSAAKDRLEKRLARFDDLAAGIQRHRVEQRSSDRETVTRSTALWVLMLLDDAVRSALESAGLSASAMSGILGLDGYSPSPERPGPLDDLFERDLHDYLEGVPPEIEVGSADVALALVRTGARGGPGLLPSRLRDLGVDVGAAVSALERLVADGAAVGFSTSVRDAAQELGQRTEVSATRLVEAVQQRHGRYVDGRFGAVALEGSVGDVRPLQDWLDQARRLYDGRAVAASSHRVLDGELLVLALAELDLHVRRALRADGLLDDWRARTTPLPRSAYSTGTQVSQDGPARVDLLGRTYLARTLVNLLKAAQKSSASSLMVHVDGPWGSGKSTLLDYVEEELGDDYLVVKVNAWREQRVGVQWWTLHRALRTAIVAQTRPRWRSRWEGLVDLVRTRVVAVVAAGLVGLAVVVAAVLLRWDNLKDATDVVGSVATLMAVGVAGLLSGYRFLLPGSRRSARTFEATTANPMREVRELFARTLRRARKPVVFFIDDLDRCDDDYLVEFLEVVQTLIRDALEPREDVTRQGPEGPYAFVAADGQWMRACYESKYGASHRSDVPGKPMGYLFLEKIFQMHVRLPALGEEVKQAFYESLLLPVDGAAPGSREQREVIESVRDRISSAVGSQGVSEASRRAQDVTDVQERIKLLGEASVRLSEMTILAETTHELAPFGRFLEPNPRTIRLFVNSVGTLQALRTLEGAGFETPMLALWTVIESRWPQLADHLRQQPEDIVQSEDPEIAALLARADVQAVVSRSGWGAITAREVRACTGVGRRAPAVGQGVQTFTGSD